jgi:tetratricopeptide (TPR) repeat protein
LAKRAVQQNDLSSAQYQYAQAIKASPEDSYLLAQYAEITFMLADSQFTDEVNRAIDKAFAIDSSNPTVLGLKGIQAFETEQWQLAITYWQEASRQMDQGSPTATALKAGIARAQMRLGIEPEQQLSPQVEISVSIDKAIQFDPNQTGLCRASSHLRCTYAPSGEKTKGRGLAHHYYPEQCRCGGGRL